jgi:hypothetical protein
MFERGAYRSWKEVVEALIFSPTHRVHEQKQSI